MVCERFENRCPSCFNKFAHHHTPCKPFPNVCPKPSANHLQTKKAFCQPNPLQTVDIQIRGFALQTYRLYIIKGFACRSHPIKHNLKLSPLAKGYSLYIIKGFPRNTTKHTRRRRPRFSTNPCGKPSFFPSPLRGTVGVNTNLFRFPLPLEGAGG